MRSLPNKKTFYLKNDTWPCCVIEDEDDLHADADEDPVLQSPDQAAEEGGERRHKVDPL